MNNVILFNLTGDSHVKYSGFISLTTFYLKKNCKHNIFLVFYVMVYVVQYGMEYVVN